MHSCEFIHYQLKDGTRMLMCRDLHSSAWSHGNTPEEAYYRMMDCKRTMERD